MKTQIFNFSAVALLALGIFFGSSSAHADTSSLNRIFGGDKTDDSYLVLSAAAYHFKNFDERNLFTPGVGWEYSPSAKVGWHAGTLSDSFGYQALYGGINYASQPKFYGKVRFILGATVLHKQYKINADPETRIVPLPAMEIKLTNKAVLNLSGSPQVDYANQKNNGVLFVQFKLQL